MATKRTIFTPQLDLDTQSAIPLHHQLAQGIMRELRQCHVPAGTSIQSILTMAQTYHLNRDTVRKAFAELEAEQVIRRTPGGRIHEVTECFVQANASRRLHAIGLVLPKRLSSLLGQPSHTAMKTVIGMMDEAADLGISAMVIPLPDNTSDVERQRGWLLETLGSLDGLVYLGEDSQSSHSRAFDILLADRKLPQVFVSGHRFRSHLGLVHIDMAQGFRAAADHLWQLGHRHAAICAAPIPRRTYFQLQTYNRADELKQAWEQHSPLPDSAFFLKTHEELQQDQDFRALMLSPNPPTAILCTNDSLAENVIGILSNLGLRVPRDVSVIGYGNTGEVPGLTTISHPWQESGAAAVTMIADSWRRGMPVSQLDVSLPTSLVVRNTTAPANISPKIK